jgi:molybdate transport system substrate-binding protein
LALAPTILSQSDHALVDAAWHQPLIQRMVLLKQAPASAQAFYDHLSTPAVRAVMSRYGFALPPA